MFKIIGLAILLFFTTSTIHGADLIQNLDAGSESDSDLVHGLAHFAAGILIVSCLNITLKEVNKLTPNNKINPWEASLVEIGFAVLIDEGYEAGTNKTNTVATQHDLASFAGATLLCAQVNWNF